MGVRITLITEGGDLPFFVPTAEGETFVDDAMGLANHGVFTFDDPKPILKAITVTVERHDKPRQFRLGIEEPQS